MLGPDRLGAMMPMTYGRLAGLATLLVVLAAGPAGAQGVIEVPRGGDVVVQNSTECAPNTDVLVSFVAPGASPVRVGGAVSDLDGHFASSVTIPTDAPLGAATIVVDCDVVDGVLVYDVSVVEATSSSLIPTVPSSAVAIGLGALAVVVLGALVLGRLKRRADAPPTLVAAEPTPTADAAGESASGDADPVPASADAQDEAGASEEHQEDEPEYWFWGAETERGPVKRLACLTDHHFFLHEVPADRFSELLEVLSVNGPERALSDAFFRVAVADIDEIRHRRTEIRVVHHTGDGVVAQTIDLATEVDGVVDLLSRRVPVIADTAAPASTT